MTTDIPLSSGRMSELEPFEGNDRERVMLSPFAVPHSISVEYLDADHIYLLRFGYSGGEAALPPIPLDQSGSPQVTVRISALTRKVLELQFLPAISVVDVPSITRRLLAAAQVTRTQSMALSYRMIGAILEGYGQYFIREATKRR